MQPAGRNRRSPQKVKDELTDEGENTRVVPLSVEAEEFSLCTEYSDNPWGGIGW